MDVVPGATDVPVSRGLISCLIGLLSVMIASAWAIEDNKPLQHSADKQVWNRKTNVVILTGNATVRQPGEILTADTITLDLNARTLDARGNCVYIAADTLIHGEEMHFNLETRTGSIVSGRVSNDRFTLSGERINKLGDRRFQTHWGEYSTCRDCPRSWSFNAEDVDMQVEGYAYMKNVMIKIKDAPAVWLPYLVVPMKTRRQSGLLFPQLGGNDQNGFMFVQPFFWAISDNADMTLGYGFYTAKGQRVEWEGRYILSPRSQGTANLYYVRDGSEQFRNVVPNRWALNLAQTHEFPFGIEGKLRILESSDNLYPNYFNDIPGRTEAALESDLILSHRSSDVSAFVAARRFRNLLNVNLDPDRRITEFDPNTVQAYPTAVVTTNDRVLFDRPPVVAGITLGMSNFTRSAGPFDYDIGRVPPGARPPAGLEFAPGVDPIREATRVSLTPTLYTTLRPFDVFSVVPSVRYYSHYYSFHGFNQATVPNLFRGYLLFQTDLSTQLERVFEMEDPDIPRAKNLIRPMLRYSYIPPSYVREDDKHPFIQQIKPGTGRSGYNFDNIDIVPLDATPSDVNYFVPLGNSLTYGLTTQFIRRRGRTEALDATYQRTAEFSVGHSINFRNHKEPLARFLANGGLVFDKVVASAEYSYTPYINSPRHVLSTSSTYVFERGVHERILAFDRSVSVNYLYSKIGADTNNLTGVVNYSLSDFVMPSFNTSFDVNNHRFSSYGVGVQFQSPSRCWRLSLALARDITVGLRRGFDFSLNLTGSGFGGVTDLAAQAGVLR